MKEVGNDHPSRPAETHPRLVANHSKTSLMVENEHIQHDNNQTTAKSNWVSNSETSVSFITALRSTLLVTVLFHAGNSYCHQFHVGIRLMATVFI